MKRKMKFTNKWWLFGFSITVPLVGYTAEISTIANAQEESSPAVKRDVLGSPNNQYSNSIVHPRSKAPPIEAPENAAAVAAEEAEIDRLKNAYISPYNYLQDPIAYNMGTSSVAAGANGTFHIGVSSVNSASVRLNSQNFSVFSETGEVWGQTERWGGLALGGTLSGSATAEQVGQPNTYATTGLLIPSQAYLDWQYKDILDITGGNVILTNPWVNSISNYPGATYANSNAPFQALQANIQVNKNLLLTGFRAFTYQQYPNNWFNYETLYNTSGDYQGLAQTPGATGVGATWNPTNNYNFNLWYYNFIGQADMWYFDNHYHQSISKNVSMDFGIQLLNQTSSGDVFTSSTYQTIQGQIAQTPGVAGNAVGAEWAINTGNNTLLLAYNNVFGTPGSLLNGGIITPYTYGLETDPLYTTPALSSIAELGSGSAYLIKDTMHFLDNSLKASLAFAQFYVNQVAAWQPGLQTEYDAALQYTVPKTNLNIWTRVVYIDTSQNAGGSFWQPRLIVNWTY